LLENVKFRKGEKLVSPDGKNHAILQTDGNFVVYVHDKPKWASKTIDKGHFLILQEDDNLVLYDQAKKPRWATNTTKQGGGKKLKLLIQNDGNLVLYDSDWKALWATGTKVE